MDNIYTRIKRQDHHNPFLFNGLLWSLSFSILLFIFSKGNIPLKIDYIYTICFLITLVIPVSINLYILIPRLLKKEHYFFFTIAFILNLIIFSSLRTLLFNPLMDTLFPEYFFVSYHSNTRLITIFSIFLITITLIKLSEDWFYFNRNENRSLKIKNRQIEMQLLSLRSQINPHFLFNSLNVIYALAIEKKDQTKDAIIQLSDILRYIIYDSNTEKVTLKEELKLLKNYIEFQKLRVRQFDAVTLDIAIENEDFELYPMLLLPLLENSYKHGEVDDLNTFFIHLKINQKKERLNFSITNSISEKRQEQKELQQTGIGLSNIKKNLEIIYSDMHKLEIDKTLETFTVNLLLKSQKPSHDN